MPYTLRFTYTVVEQRYPYGSTLASTGDLVGTGIWSLAERDRGVDVQYEWRVRLEKPLLRLISSIARRFWLQITSGRWSAGKKACAVNSFAAALLVANKLATLHAAES